MVLPINLIPDDVYKKLFLTSQSVVDPLTEKSVKDNLHNAGLGDVMDQTVFPVIAVPTLDQKLPAWIEDNAKAVYQPYFNYCQMFCNLDITEIKMPDILPLRYRQWYKIENDKYIKTDILPQAVILDFEAIRKLNTKYSPVAHYYPFLVVCLGSDGNAYLWYDDVNQELLQHVSFPGVVFAIGHNITEFDRRYITECYEDIQPLFMLDTRAMYQILMGTASQSQRNLKAKFVRDGIPLQDWMYQTTAGSLAALYEFFKAKDNDLFYDEQKNTATKNTLDKTVREKIIDGNLEYITANLKDVIQYCADDIAATLYIFKKLWVMWVDMIPSMVTFGGQLERSHFRLGVVPDYYERLAKIDKQILEIKTERNNQIETWIEQSKDYVYLKKYIENWLDTELESRKSKAKNPDKIVRKDIKGFIKSLWKKAKPEQLTTEKYISITSRAIVYALQITWYGRQLEYTADGWGIYNEHDQWVKLPHPKGGDGNVGTPLSKDFRNKAVTGEFKSNVVNLLEVFDTISTISTWQGFRDRLYSAYIVEYKGHHYWLTDNLASGTVSERLTGTAVVLPNTNPRKAGTEVKHFFGSFKENKTKISGDYKNQEGFIFAGFADKKRGYIGSTPLSVLTLSGTDPHDRTGNILLGLLTDEQKTELEQIYGAPLLKKLRVLWKSINYANQYLCGVKKQASQIYLAVQGKIDMETNEKLAKSFIDNSRGVLEYGKYVNGFASDAYNEAKQNAQKPVQRTYIYNREISRALQGRFCHKDFLTTRFNFNIQQTGQELINTCLVVMRIIQKILSDQYDIEIVYRVMNLIHDELLIEVDNTPDGIDLGVWLFQIGHLFSKCMFYHALGINQVPSTGSLLETVEIDRFWRKSVTDDGVTPSNPTPTPEGKYVTAEDFINKLPQLQGIKLNTLPSIDSVKSSSDDSNEKFLLLLE